MKKTPKKLSPDEWAGLILGLALLFGLIVRLFPAWTARFPLNDGGMFLSMIRELRENGFLLPSYTTYNRFDIPYAYPPFGFYVAGLLNALGIPVVEVLHWMPPLVNALAIGGIYLLGKEFLNDRPRAAVAAAFFALTPGSYSWQIMGGGLTRSLGMAFLALSVYAVHRMFREETGKSLLFAILVCSLAVLSHPEAGLETAASCALAVLFFGRSRRGLGRAALTAAGVAVLTSWWWGTLLRQHGTAPFLSVLHSGGYYLSPWQALYGEFLAPGKLFTLLGLLQLTGLIWSLWKKQFFLPAWLALPYFIEPRSAPAMSFLPACLFASLALLDALPALIDSVRARRGLAVFAGDITQRPWLSILVSMIILYFFVASALFGFRLVKTSLIPPGPQEAMTWVRDNTPADSRFLILTGEAGIMTDPIQEWFPALADRRSQTTLQGLEWTLGEGFFPRLESLVELQRCRGVPCVGTWSAENGLDYSHLLIQKETEALLLGELNTDSEYRLIFENSEFAVFTK